MSPPVMYRDKESKRWYAKRYYLLGEHTIGRWVPSDPPTGDYFDKKMRLRHKSGRFAKKAILTEPTRRARAAQDREEYMQALEEAERVEAAQTTSITDAGKIAIGVIVLGTGAILLGRYLTRDKPHAVVLRGFDEEESMSYYSDMGTVVDLTKIAGGQRPGAPILDTAPVTGRTPAAAPAAKRSWWQRIDWGAGAKGAAAAWQTREQRKLAEAQAAAAAAQQYGGTGISPVVAIAGVAALAGVVLLARRK